APGQDHQQAQNPDIPPGALHWRFLPGEGATDSTRCKGRTQPFPNAPFHFRGVENLTGGAGNDVFSFNRDQLVSGAIDGGGHNWLDYGSFTTSVVANLATGVATNTGGIANIGNVRGGKGDDTLTAAASG